VVGTGAWAGVLRSTSIVWWRSRWDGGRDGEGDTAATISESNIKCRRAPRAGMRAGQILLNGRPRI
jgi:hypothetical protein